MLDRVSTVVLGLDGKGGAERFGDYGQWEKWSREEGRGKREEGTAPISGTATGGEKNPGKKKLSYLEAREYAAIEVKVEEAEEKLNAARDRLDDPSVATNADALTLALHDMEKAQEEADALYQRWAELTEKAG
jgi:ATP-binding cassette subfamily F protein uup